MGCTAPDHGADTEDRRTAFFSLRIVQSSVDQMHITTVLHRLDVPSIGLEALPDILGKGKCRGTGQADTVVIIEYDKFAQTKMSGQGTGLGRDTFHKIPVADQNISKMVDNFVTRPVISCCQMSFRYRHAHCTAEPLSQGACGHFHTGCVAIFRMTGRFTFPLPEGLDIGKTEIIAG